jgi:hypothetical protein
MLTDQNIPVPLKAVFDSASLFSTVYSAELFSVSSGQRLIALSASWQIFLTTFGSDGRKTSVLKSAGIPVVQTYRLDQPDELARFNEDRLAFDLGYIPHLPPGMEPIQFRSPQPQNLEAALLAMEHFSNGLEPFSRQALSDFLGTLTITDFGRKARR